MQNLNITYQLPSGEWHELALESQQFIEALIEKGADDVFPMLITCIEMSSKSQCGKIIKTTLLNNNDFEAMTEIE